MWENIPTNYKGKEYKSRFEANFARIIDTLEGYEDHLVRTRVQIGGDGNYGKTTGFQSGFLY